MKVKIKKEFGKNMDERELRYKEAAIPETKNSGEEKICR